jgi:hypothetical protein
MSHDARLSRGSVAGQGENRPLSDEVHGRVLLVQFRQDRSERLPRMQLLRRLCILGVHVHHEVGARGKDSHVTSRIPTIGKVNVGLNERRIASRSAASLAEMFLS